jgi:hypothetical protein
MKNYKFQIALFLMCFFLGLNTLYSQEAATKDFELWNAVGIEYSVSKKFKIALSEHLRLKENAQTTDAYFTELSLEYELLKDFEIGVGFRHITKNDNQGAKQGFENHFRYNIDLSYKYDMNRFTASHRIRYQNKNHLGVDEAGGDLTSQSVRIKSGLKYDIKNSPLTPSFSLEIFNKFTKNDSFSIRKYKTSKYRINLGLSYKWDEVGKFRLFYRRENNIIEKQPKNVKILGLNYVYAIN